MDNYSTKKYSDDKKEQPDKGSDLSLREVKASPTDFAAGKPYRGKLKNDDDHNLNEEYRKTKVDSEVKDDIRVIEPTLDKTIETIDINEVRKNFTNISKEILKVYEDFNCILRENNIDNRNISYLKEEYTLLKREYEYTFNAKAAYNAVEKIKILLNDLKTIKDIDVLKTLGDFSCTYEVLKTTYNNNCQLFKDKSVMKIYSQLNFTQKEYDLLIEKFKKFKKSTEIESIKNIINEMKMFTSKLESAHIVKNTLKMLGRLKDLYIKIDHTYNNLSFSLKEAAIFKRSGIFPEIYQSLVIAHDSIMEAVETSVSSQKPGADQLANPGQESYDERSLTMFPRKSDMIQAFKAIYAEQDWSTKLSAIEEQGQRMLKKLEKLKKEVEQSRQQHRIWEKFPSRFSPNYRVNQVKR